MFVLKKSRREHPVRALYFLPNLLSGARIVLTFFFLHAFLQGPEYVLSAFCYFTLAVLSDLVDGYLARSCNATTACGAFLDPLADKILVFGAFGSCWFMGLMSGWILALLALRDLFVTIMRCFLLTGGKTLETSFVAKSKTVLQFFTIYLFFGYRFLEQFPDVFLRWYLFFLSLVTYGMLFLALYSALSYLLFLKNNYVAYRKIT